MLGRLSPLTWLWHHKGRCAVWSPLSQPPGLPGNPKEPGVQGALGTGNTGACQFRHSPQLAEAATCYLATDTYGYFYPLAIEAAAPWMPAFTSFSSFLLLPLSRHLLNEQLWRLRCSAPLRSASRELAQSFLPAPFLGLPLGVSTDAGPCP